MLQSLDEVRAFVLHEARRLDPQSRYITELLATVDAARNPYDLTKRLEAGCRGRYWAGESRFEQMTLEEKLRCNLVTNETQLMRFDDAELEFLRQRVLPAIRRRGRATQVLSLPCSHGEEAVSLASEALQAGVRKLRVTGIDIQSACIASARSGTLPYPGLPRGVEVRVSRWLTKHLAFRVGDAFTDDLGGPYDLIVCRNFLGYFVPSAVREVLTRLCAAMTPNDSYLLVDSFILGKHPEAFHDLPLQRLGELPAFVHLVTSPTDEVTPCP